MTDEEAKALYEDLKKYYGEKLVDFEVFPSIFAHQVKLYRYYKGTKDESRSNNGTGN